ncbi:hypothetical protein E2C01_099208 [Portunus trituberculatus]|uniref:Uncharacterized protein n=1 Tax=Portunus trituberculatus TaxID=210409 RepID=A0A5B7KAD7_PORTR|nr:hypothetical protein [Portunus trituberculatus]
MNLPSLHILLTPPRRRPTTPTHPNPHIQIIKPIHQSTNPTESIPPLKAEVTANPDPGHVPGTLRRLL